MIKLPIAATMAFAMVWMFDSSALSFDGEGKNLGKTVKEFVEGFNKISESRDYDLEIAVKECSKGKSVRCQYSFNKNSLIAYTTSDKKTKIISEIAIIFAPNNEDEKLEILEHFAASNFAIRLFSPHLKSKETGDLTSELFLDVLEKQKASGSSEVDIDGIQYLLSAHEYMGVWFVVSPAD